MVWHFGLALGFGTWILGFVPHCTCFCLGRGGQPPPDPARSWNADPGAPSPRPWGQPTEGRDRGDCWSHGAVARRWRRSTGSRAPLMAHLRLSLRARRTADASCLVIASTGYRLLRLPYLNAGLPSAFGIFAAAAKETRGSPAPIVAGPNAGASTKDWPLRGGIQERSRVPGSWLSGVSTGADRGGYRRKSARCVPNASSTYRP